MNLKVYLFFILLFVFSCWSNNKSSGDKQQYSFKEIDNLLKGETLGKKHTQKNFTQKTINYICDINYVGNNSTSNEVNLVFKDAEIESYYKSFVTFYNKHFESNNNNKVFNTWSTDSLEVLLFKQTDSTILVNIFIKTYR